MPLEQAPPHVILLQRADLSAALPVLVSAFRDDPLMRYLFADAPLPYEGNVSELFRFSCEARLLLKWPLLGSFGEGQLMGVAGMTDPDETAWPRRLQQVYRDMQRAIGPVAATRLEEYAALADVYRPDTPHFHLGMMGVRPEAQGQGHGGALLAAAHTIAERHPRATGVWLDTENERSIPFYERYDYRTVAQTTLERVTIWSLFRPNHSLRHH